MAHCCWEPLPEKAWIIHRSFLSLNIIYWIKILNLLVVQKPHFYKTIELYYWMNRFPEQFGIINIGTIPPISLQLAGKYLQKEQKYFSSINRLLKHHIQESFLLSLEKISVPTPSRKNSPCHWYYRVTRYLRMLIFEHLSISASIYVCLIHFMQLSLEIFVRICYIHLNWFYITTRIAPEVDTQQIWGWWWW